jgi:hypothetical protein
LNDSPLAQFLDYALGGPLPDPVQLGWAISKGYVSPVAPHYVILQAGWDAIPGATADREVLVAIKLGCNLKTTSGKLHAAGTVGWVLNSGRDRMGTEWQDVLLSGEHRLLRVYHNSDHLYAVIYWPPKWDYKPHERNLWPSDFGY